MLDKTDTEKRVAEYIERIVAHAQQQSKGAVDPQVADFIRLYYARVPYRDLVAQPVIDLYGAALAHVDFARKRTPGQSKVRVYNPRFEKHGWQSTHTILEIVTDDRPFLVDSITMLINRSGFTTHLTIHPILGVTRDAKGRIEAVGEINGESSVNESFMQFQLDRQTDAAVLEELEQGVQRTLDDVRRATEDWPAMRESTLRVMEDMSKNKPPHAQAEIDEVVAFCEWIETGHFTYMATCDYAIEGGKQPSMKVVEGSALGLLNNRERSAEEVAADLIPMDAAVYLRDKNLLMVTKANARATVHRSSYLDFIAVKRYDAKGKVSGLSCIFGLFTSAAYRRDTRDIPMLRQKVLRVIDASELVASSHEGKALDNILQSYPRDELFQATETELLSTAMGILELQERQRIRLFHRRDSFGRYHACLVYVPREKYSRELRLAIQDILLDDLEGKHVEFDTLFSSESVLARLYYTIHTDPQSQPGAAIEEIEKHLIDAARSWQDQLRTALIEQEGEELGNAHYSVYADAFPASYREDFSARSGAYDIRQIEKLRASGGIAMQLYRPPTAVGGTVRFKLFSYGVTMSLSEVLPVIENMGLKVTGEWPYEIACESRETTWLHEFDLCHSDGEEIDPDESGEMFQEAFARVWYGEAESDGFNRLVLRAGLNWRDTVMLRAYCKYLLQLRVPFSQDYMIESLVVNASIARLLCDLFHARLDPAGVKQMEKRSQQLMADIDAALDAVENLDQDRILRCFLELITATLRTNFYQKSDGSPKGYLSFKFDPQLIARMPLPKPKYEIFVYSPRMEAVHLRGGSVARGGLRWSDRREDFRTEILGLVKAQMVKNAVIVPVGSKGGFVCKRLPEGDRETVMNEVVSCYKTFMCGMLDITDNLKGQQVVPPPDVVRFDGDDPYLVIAADKGTATFSDIANGVAAEYGFWLDDAYASGGSVGYDHKKMGITAKGAWESVKRHFRELGVDTQSTDFTVVGIGDMGGDVFGNGMLLSRHIKLVAAFNHMHIFLDPDPDPEQSFKERERLFNLPRSSWADYDQKLISAGGGVYERSAKSVPLSEQVQHLLNVKDESLTPTELMHVILQARVDLLWNGGIGTYVKAQSETHEQVRDRANDGLRVNGSELRCKVIGEGGNLGFTQLGRIEYARNGGRVYTDSIDNSAGVDCSDHEVNIKILLNSIVANGDMTSKQRVQLLMKMTDEVGELVLQDNYAQTGAISITVAEAPQLLDEQARFMRALEHDGFLNRAIEYLPDDEVIAERAANQQGLTSPELAILLSYSKMRLYDEVLASDVPEDPFVTNELVEYFPTDLRQRFLQPLSNHRLRREIIATRIINDLINRLGPSFVYRITTETGAPVAEIVRAYVAARDIFAMEEVWQLIEGLDNKVVAETQTEMTIVARGLLERAMLWLVRNRRTTTTIEPVVEKYRAGVVELSEGLPRPLDAASRLELRKRAKRLSSNGVSQELATRIGALIYLSSALDIVDVAALSKAPVATVAAVYFELGARLDLQWLREQVAGLIVRNNWHNLAKSALRHDIHNQQRDLAAQALATIKKPKRAKEVVEHWMSETAELERYNRTMHELKAGGQLDFAMLSVALNEVRGLTVTAT